MGVIRSIELSLDVAVPFNVFEFELSANRGSWEARPFALGDLECSASLEAICSRLRSKFDLRARLPKASCSGGAGSIRLATGQFLAKVVLTLAVQQ